MNKYRRQLDGHHDRQQEGQQGFTLIELMATLGILALIVAIAVPAIGSIMNDAEAGSKKASISMIEEAGQLAYLGNLDFDNKDKKRYSVLTLVQEGYLDLVKDSDLYTARNYVEQQANNTFVYNADGPIVPEDVNKTAEGMYNWNVLVGGVYQVEVWGAAGGDGGNTRDDLGYGDYSYHYGDNGLDGDYAKTRIRLDAGDMLRIRVGGRGQNGPTGYDDSGGGAGGGGSSAIAFADSSSNPFIMAAGGNGGNGWYEASYGVNAGQGGFNDGQDGSGIYGGDGGGTTMIRDINQISSSYNTTDSSVSSGDGEVKITFIKE